MQEKHVPSLGLRYSFVFCMVSIFGANASDLATVLLGAGHVRGLPMLAVALVVAAILVVELFDKSSTHAWYWLVIAIIPMASINLADPILVDMGLGEIWVILALAVLLLLTLIISRSEATLLVSELMIARPGPHARPLTDAGHWFAMVVATSLGTIVGDYCSISLRLGLVWASVLLSVLVLAVFWLHRVIDVNRLFLYWLTIVALRAAGAVIADLLAKQPHLALGLPVSTALTGALSLALLILWRDRRGERVR